MCLMNMYVSGTLSGVGGTVVNKTEIALVLVFSVRKDCKTLRHIFVGLLNLQLINFLVMPVKQES